MAFGGTSEQFASTLLIVW